MKTTYRHGSLLLLALIAALFAPAVPAHGQEATWEVTEDQWYALELADQRVGWMRARLFDDGGRFRTDTETRMKLARGGMELEITMISSFTETHDGEPLRMRSVQDMSIQEVEQEWIFKGDEVLTISRQGGREITKKLPRPEGDWMTPAAVARHIAKQIEAGKVEIKYSMLSPEQGLKPIDVTMSYVGDDLYPIDERFYPVTKWKTTTSAVPLAATEMYDAEGNSVYSEIHAQFGKLVTKLTTREKALGIEDEPAEVAAKAPGGGEVEMEEPEAVREGDEDLPAGGGLPEKAPELMLESFVKLDEPVRNAHKTTTARLRLRARNGDLPELPSAGAQRAEVDPDTDDVILTVDINDNLPASGEDLSNEDYLDSTTMVDATDPFVRKLAERATRNAGDDAFRKAERLRRLVHRHISKKGLATAFASASETARTRTGDCSEHGVLLAALLRAQGIPSRVAMGLVYADSFAGAENIFGWHMWTQALIDDKWVDFDATLPVRYSATHVLTGTSSLADGIGSTDLSSLLLLMGNLEIEVEDVGYDDVRHADDEMQSTEDQVRPDMQPAGRH